MVFKGRNEMKTHKSILFAGLFCLLFFGNLHSLGLIIKYPLAGAEIVINPSLGFEFKACGIEVSWGGLLSGITPSVMVTILEYEQVWLKYPEERTASYSVLSFFPLCLRLCFLKGAAGAVSVEAGWKWFSNHRNSGFSEIPDFYKRLTWASFSRELTSDYDIRLSWTKEYSLYDVRPSAEASLGCRFRPGNFASLYLSIGIAFNWYPLSGPGDNNEIY